MAAALDGVILEAIHELVDFIQRRGGPVEHADVEAELQNEFFGQWAINREPAKFVDWFERPEAVGNGWKINGDHAGTEVETLGADLHAAKAGDGPFGEDDLRRDRRLAEASWSETLTCWTVRRESVGGRQVASCTRALNGDRLPPPMRRAMGSSI